MHVAPFVPFAPAALVLPAVVLASCTDSSSPTPPADAPAPASAKANAPPASGPNVVRIQSAFLTFPGIGQGVTLTAGLVSSPADFCAHPEQAVLSPGVEQDVSTPSGSVHILASSHEAHLVLYGATETGDVCDLVGAPVLGTGTGQFQVTLNDVDETGPGATTGIERVHGTITLASGGELRVQALHQVTLRPDGTLVHDRTTLTLTPVGGP
jgi:hypothetical protein